MFVLSPPTSTTSASVKSTCSVSKRFAGLQDAPRPRIAARLWGDSSITGTNFRRAMLERSFEHVHCPAIFEPENAERPTLNVERSTIFCIQCWTLDVGRWTLDVGRCPSTPGGVAEWLIAPVLKTGRPKGLVSSNLTPSASLIIKDLCKQPPKTQHFGITNTPKSTPVCLCLGFVPENVRNSVEPTPAWFESFRRRFHSWSASEHNALA